MTTWFRCYSDSKNNLIIHLDKEINPSLTNRYWQSTQSLDANSLELERLLACVLFTTMIQIVDLFDLTQTI